MVIMENYRLAQNSFRELWHEIEICHLSYLEMEDSSEKFDQRAKLEEYIQEFLCVAANSQKFSFAVTEDVLEQSAMYKKDFSGYKAATGFNAIQLYAGNLLSQPWRKEYRAIKTYCGFYKHQIEANLVGAEKMFQAMGYQLHGDRLLVLEGPICPDRVKTVSKDCLVAYVECQIWKAIWEELSTSYKATWYEVLKFRKDHICSPEQAVKALRYKQQQRQYEVHSRGFSQGYDTLNGVRGQPVPIANMAPMVVNHSFPPLNNHLHAGLPRAQECQYVGGCCSNYVDPRVYGYMSYAEASSRPSLNTNGYYNGYIASQPAPQYAVPTAKLIEVESQIVPPFETHERPAAKPRHADYVNNELYKAKNNNDARNNFTDEASDKNESQFEDWEYVYRNLESQGYSKDLGERGDVLSPNSARLAREAKKIKATNLDEALNNLSVNDLGVNDRTRYSEVAKKTDGGKNKNLDAPRIDMQTSPSSSYDNLATAPSGKKPAQKSNPLVNYVKTKTLPRDKTAAAAAADKPSNSRTLDGKAKEDKTKKKTTGKLADDRWHCKACTFLNGAGADICEICGKSRSAALEPPIEVGGAECSKCTLVNSKSKTVCDACGASLKGSPTYI